MKFYRIKINYINLKDIKYPREISKTKQWWFIRNKLLEVFDKCMKCKSKNNLELDHIKPINKYPKLGFNNDNLQILCSSCNKLKSDIKIKDYRNNYQKRLISNIFKDHNYLKYNKIYKTIIR